jgi:hypothetical protein
VWYDVKFDERAIIMKSVALTLTGMIVIAIGSPLPAQDVDLQRLVDETQEIDQRDDLFRMVWWIPTEFWKASFADDPDMTQAQKDELYKVVDEYIVLCVVDAQMTALASVIPTAREELVSQLAVAIDQEYQMAPLSDSDIASDTRNLLAMMEPLLANMLGQFGEGMEFFCFKGVDSNGEKLLNPRERGEFSVKLGDSIYKWRLPLGSLLPSRYDPETGEEFPGNYIYSPFTGKKLLPEPSGEAIDSDKK